MTTTATIHPSVRAGMSERKRKRDAAPQTPNKKVALDGTSPITVSSNDANALHPVLVSSCGISKPSIPFHAYARSRSSKHGGDTPKPATHDLLLHSSKHPTLDYTAAASPNDDHLTHYIALYNPSAKSLQITPVHHLQLACVLRSEQQQVEQDRQRQTMAQQREQLGMEFGTKKAKKAIASKTENAIMRDGSGKQDDAQSAVLEGMATTAGAESTEQTLEQQLALKPIPQPNLNAETADEVYALNTLISPGDMRLVPYKDWLDKAKAKTEINLNYRFPAFRVAGLGNNDDVVKLKALGYLNLLLEFHAALSGGGRNGKKVPKKDVLRKKISPYYPEALVDSVRRRFSENNELSKWHMDKLVSHMAALSLFVDGWVTNTANLKDDLRLENKAISQYFSELGCRVGPPTEKERMQMNIKKEAASANRVARLKLPLEFPKLRTRRR